MPRNIPSNCKLDAALRAARRGWPVIPLHWPVKGGCSCRNQKCGNSTAKHPLTAHGLKDATTDEARIRAWWKESPQANIGIATGAGCGIVVLDVDSRHGGPKSLRKLETKHGPLPTGPRVQSGGGGTHYFFAHPGSPIKSKTGPFPGIDVRGDGAYIVGAGSIHASGERYLWEHGKTPSKLPLPPLPGWLSKQLAKEQPPQREPVDAIRDGQRNSTLTSFAGTMRRRGMTPEAIELALLEENRLRCAPPLEDTEVRGIASSIGKYAPEADKILSALTAQQVRAQRNLLFRTGAEIASETPPKPFWVARPWVAQGATTELGGKVKLAGKTTFSTNMVRAVLDGAPFMGEQTIKTPVLYLTEQNPTSFREAMKRAALLGREDFIALFWKDTLGMSWPEVVHAAVDECKRRSAKLLVVDTLHPFAGLGSDRENNSGDALLALQPLQLAADEGIGVLIVRHERKRGGEVADSGRGSSAYAGAVDIVLSLRRAPGNQKRNVRLIQAVSRFDETPSELLIELGDGGYRSLGEPGEAAREQTKDVILAALLETKKEAVDIEVLAERTKISRAQLQRVLEELLKEGKIEKTGKGRKGDPLRYSAS
ncbi:MAG: bifunctional DNA primase/polymerase [Candidatus Acidiferrales bacterium]